MPDHFHIDIVNAAYIGAVAIISINVLRIIAAWLIDRNIGVGKTIGALVA